MVHSEIFGFNYFSQINKESKMKYNVKIYTKETEYRSTINLTFTQSEYNKSIKPKIKSKNYDGTLNMVNGDLIKITTSR